MAEPSGASTRRAPRVIFCVFHAPPDTVGLTMSVSVPKPSKAASISAAVTPLDHRVGEPVDVVVNGRIVARGEVVIVEDDNSRFGVSLTEIVGVQAKFEE